MHPDNFPEANKIIGEHQEEFQNLPAFVDSEGNMVFCWKLSLRERLRVLFTGKIWHSVSTNRKPLQPIYISTKKEEHLTTISDGGSDNEVE